MSRVQAAWVTGFALVSMSWADGLVWTATTCLLVMTSLALARHTPRRWVVGFLFLLTAPFWMARLWIPGPVLPPSNDQIRSLQASLETPDIFRVMAMDELLSSLQGHRSSSSWQNLEHRIQAMELPAHTSFTLYNLNLEPRIWKGRYFSGARPLSSSHSRDFAFADGRVFLTQVHALPHPNAVQAYLVVEQLLVSQNQNEQQDSWLSLTQHWTQRHHVVQVEPDKGDFLQSLGDAVQIQHPVPFELRFLPLAQVPWWQSCLGLMWLLVLVPALRTAHDRLPRPWRLPWLGLMSIFWMTLPHHAFSALPAFNPSIFGSLDLGFGLSSPGSLILGATLLHLWLSALAPRLHAPFLRLIALFAISCLASRLPVFFQAHTSFSLTHPMEISHSAGHVGTMLGILMVFAVLFRFIIRLSSPLSMQSRAMGALSLFAALILLHLAHPIPVMGIIIIWFLSVIPTLHPLRHILCALLTALILLPPLFLQDQNREVDTLRFDLLDEITLLGERNHSRIANLLRKINDLPMSNEQPHSESMYWLAQQTGLLRDHVAFAIKLNDRFGNTLSMLENQMTMDSVPYLLGPENRIEIFQESTSRPEYMVFRKTLQLYGETYEFVAVLRNDYGNLSLIRDLNTPGRSPTDDREYFRYDVEVFDPQGTPLLPQAEPRPLSRDALKVLDKEPYHWEVINGRLTFFFRDRGVTYRITHKPTPLRMLAARTAFVVLFAWLNTMFGPLFVRWRKDTLTRWRRSFVMQFAGIIFLASIVPTGSLSYVLLSSIRRNQVKEENAAIQSRIATARHLVEFAMDENSAKEIPQPQPDIDPSVAESPPQAHRGAEAISLARLFRQLSGAMGEDLSLFLHGTLQHTNHPQMYRRGHLMRRLPYDQVRRLIAEHQAYATQRHVLGQDELLQAFTAIRPARSKPFILAISMVPGGQANRLRWREQVEFAIAVISLILFLMANAAGLIAQRFLKPVKAITRAATRMAASPQGDRFHEAIPIHRQDELQRMVSAFNTMQEKVQWGRRELRRQLALFDVTLQSMSGALIGVNTQGHILVHNQKASDLLCTGSRSMPEKLSDLTSAKIPLDRLLQPDSPDELSFSAGFHQEKRDYLVKLRSRNTDDPRDVAHILVFEDITDALAASRFSAWSDMARRVAHEIKNPLTPIQLEIEHLVHTYAHAPEEFPEELQDSAQQIKKQVDHLRQIATEFGDYARPMQLELKPCDLNEIIDSIVHPYAKTQSRVQWEMQLNPIPRLHLDRRMLTRALHNIIENAMHAIEDKGTVRVRSFQESETVKLWVEDDGVGIPESDRDRVFDAYFSSKDYGTGLGLAIARKTLEMHHATVRIDPETQQGTRFIITFPIQDA